MKPIAVLSLVLAIVAALVFALFFLNKETPRVPVAPEQPPAPKIEPAAPSEKPPLQLEDTARAVVGKDESVFANELRVLVLDPNAKPLAGVDVTLTSYAARDLALVDGRPQPFKLGPKRTDAQGRTSFAGLQPREKYTLICVHPDFARVEEDTVPIEAEGLFEEPPITLHGGASLQGHVTDEKGHPIPDALMVLEGMVVVPAGAPAPDRMETRTDAEGHYSLQRIPPGNNRKLSASAKGYGRMLQPSLAFEQDGSRTCDLVLREAQFLAGRVVGPGNAPIAGAKVIAVGMNNALQTGRDDTLTDAQGEFRFEALAPGEYNVIANLRGWRIPPLTRVKASTSGNVLEATREASVCGQVLDAVTGAPVSEFVCQLRNYVDAETPTYPVDIKQSFRDAQGNFCLEGVQQGEFVIEARANGFAPTCSQNFVVTPGKSVQGVIVRLSKGGSIRGRIVDAQGNPVAKAHVVAGQDDETDAALNGSFLYQSSPDAALSGVRTAQDGSFVIPNLGPAQYALVVEAAGYMRASTPKIQVLDGAETKQGDLALARGGTLTGSVLDGAGKPVPGALVTLEPGDAGALPLRPSVKAGVDGRYALKNLRPGHYVVRARGNVGVEINPTVLLQEARKSQSQVTLVEGEETKLDLKLEK